MALLKTAGIEINKEQRTVRYQQQLLPLKGLTFDMLLALVDANNEIVSLEALSEQVWKGKVVSDDTIAQRISLLRKALPEHASVNIESARSEGYRWLAKVEIGTSQKPVSHKTVIALFAIATVIAVVIGLSLTWFKSEPQSLTDQMVLDPTNIPGHGLDADVFTRVKLARAQQYANALTTESNIIAIKMYRELLDTDPQNPLFRLGLAQTLLYGVSVFHADRVMLEEAEELSASLLALNPLQPQYLWLRGFYFETAKEMQSALDNYEAAYSQSSEDAQIALSLAHLYAESGRLYDAMRLNITPSIRGESRQLRQIAQLLYLTDQTDIANDWLNASVQLAPDDAVASFELAKYLMVNDRHSQALEVISEFHLNAKGNANSYVLEFILQFYFEEMTLAESALAEAERVQPQAPIVIAWRQWFNQLQSVPVTSSVPALSDNNWPNAQVAGCIQALAQDDTDTALVLLTRATRMGFLDYKYIMQMPAFDILQDNPMFTELLLMMKQRQEEQKRLVERLAIPELGGA